MTATNVPHDHAMTDHADPPGSEALLLLGKDADALPHRFRHALVRLMSERRRGRRFDLYVIHMPILFGSAALTQQARERMAAGIAKTAEEMFGDKGASMLSGHEAVVMALPGIATGLADSMVRQMGLEVRRHIFGDGRPALAGLLSRLSVWPDGSVTRGDIRLDQQQHDGQKNLKDDDVARMVRGWNVQYQPIWEVSRRALTAYRASMIRENDQGTLMTPDKLPTEIRAKLDGKLLRQAAKHLEGLLRMGKKFDLVLPLSQALTGQSAIFADFLRELATLPDIIRRHLLIEIDVTLIERDLNQLLQLRQVLSPHCRGLLARTGLSAQAIPMIAKAGWLGCGMDLSMQDYDESGLMQLLNIYAEQAEQHRQKTFLCGVRTFSVTTAAVCAGFDHVDGPAVHQVIGIPNQAMRFDILDLFARLS